MNHPQLSIAFQTDKPLAAYGPLAAAAEAYGFDGVSVFNDLLYQPAWLPLLEIARATRRVRLGPAAVNPFTCHPLNIAANIALIDEAAHGRAYLGLARGAWLDFAGLEPERPAAVLREAFACVRHLLSRSTAPLPGEHFPLAGGDALRWPGIRPDIPFLLGSWGPRTLAACLPYVEEVKLGGTANPAALRWAREIVGAAPVRLAVGAVTVVAEDGAAARALARREVALYLPVVAELGPGLPLEPARLAAMRAAAARYDYEAAAGCISDELLDLVCFAGTPETVADQALALFEAGAGRVEFGTPHGLSEEDGLRLLGERVLPAIRARL
ncbi:MAG TPA: LLM class flavin-dependent oxidoreductase [Thermomicrobiaceae bacterium]|nr:LLM class flavin-dependent oxidoreductase [Thermomicrobiaceae bacterium]